MGNEVDDYVRRHNEDINDVMTNAGKWKMIIVAIPIVSHNVATLVLYLHYPYTKFKEHNDYAWNQKISSFLLLVSTHVGYVAPYPWGFPGHACMLFNIRGKN